MQIFECPFCGKRNETEFHFLTEAGKERPEPAEDVSDSRWAEYLYLHKSPRGKTNEIWVHIPCGEFFILQRDTITREVFRSISLQDYQTIKGNNQIE